MFAQFLNLRGRHICGYFVVKITELVNFITLVIFIFKIRGTYLTSPDPRDFSPTQFQSNAYIKVKKWILDAQF